MKPGKTRGAQNMIALLVMFLLLAVGFGAGYGTRELISRKRRAEYLEFQSYFSPSRRPPLSAHPRAKAEHAQTTHDITGSFQEVHIRKHKPAPVNPHLIHPGPEQPDTRPSGESARFEESLDELVSLLQRGPHQT
jgi:hypothetical protein